MFDPRRSAVLAVATTLAFPAGALAQGASDNQYQDPFGAGATGSSGSSGSSSSGSSGSSDSSGSGSSSSGSTGSSSSGASGSGSNSGSLSTQPPAATEQQVTNTQARPGELARTGADAGLVALLGAGMVLSGTGMRLRLRGPGRLPA
jgi:hypothetical protein